jgi:hypothetical protein
MSRYCFQVCRRAGSTTKDICTNAVYLFAALICHHAVVGCSGIGTQYDICALLYQASYNGGTSRPELAIGGSSLENLGRMLVGRERQLESSITCSGFWLLIRDIWTMRKRLMSFFHYSFRVSSFIIQEIEVQILEAGSVVLNDSCPRASKRISGGRLIVRSQSVVPQPQICSVSA